MEGNGTKCDGSDAKVIFGEALLLDAPGEREAYLDRVCAGDQALRGEIDSLLRAYAQAGDFLEDTQPLPAPGNDSEGSGTTIGRYKLLEQIG